MDKTQLTDILNKVANGEISVNEATQLIKTYPYKDLGYAKIDTHRGVRQGASEVVYGEGKTKEQTAGIVKAMLDGGENAVLITRLSEDSAAYLSKLVSLKYDSLSKIAVAGNVDCQKQKSGKIVVAAAGTSDLSVAEEAALTAEFYGCNVVRLYDVGVSGVHRLLDNISLFADANLVIAVAGMEGALPGVIAGLVDCPVIAVPTSVGYGASFGGLSALLAMLNSCASGVSVVNIDNGFGAGYIAGMINKSKEKL